MSEIASTRLIQVQRLRFFCGLILLWLLLWFSPIAPASTQVETAAIPPALTPWAPWVLRDADWRDCPLAPASVTKSAVGSQGRLCRWPGILQLEADADAGRFTQDWRLYAPGWVPLPGDEQAWPQQVRVNGEAQPVLAREGRPAVFLPAGDYAISGTFVWSRLPDGLQLPEVRAQVRLRSGAVDTFAPRIDAAGRLWLGAAPNAATDVAPGSEDGNATRADTLALDVTRLLADGVPVRLTTRLDLEVSGQPRELRLDGAVLPGALALRIDSPLPAHLDQQGRLQLQLRPGRWVVQVEARYPGQPTRFELADAEVPWPTREVWAFRADPALRQVEVSGVPAVDARQTRLPADWQSLPAYGLEAGDALVLQPLPAARAGRERLRLNRDLWLDFSGRGYSVRDSIEGELAGLSRLDARAPLRLGQVRVDGMPRLITRLPGREEVAEPGSAEGAADASPETDTEMPTKAVPAAISQAPTGVEVRGERLSLEADGRLEDLRGQLPASGWTVPFEGIETSLYLPPGWDLLAASGVDNLPQTWMARWSLLDLFLVLIAALACGRLWGWRWGLLALVTLTLIWQEADAPRAVWLNLLAAAALLRVLPAEAGQQALRRARGLVQWYFRATLLVLVLIALPFLLQQMRDGLYPQLSIDEGSRMGAGVANQILAERALQSAPAPAELARSAPAEGDYLSRSAGSASMAKSVAPAWNAPPPGAVLQTGAGVPDWTWNAFRLEWNGPVESDHQISLWLRPPLAGLLLACVQLLLVPLLALRLAGGWPAVVDAGRTLRQGLHAGQSAPGQTARQRSSALSILGLAVMLGVGAWLVPPMAQASRTPDPAHVASPPQPQVQAAPAPVAPVPPAEAAQAAAIFPPESLLDALREHLLSAPECWPECITLTRLHVQLSDGQLRLRLDVAAGAAGALPLPGGESTWSPQQLLLDGVELPQARRTKDGHLLVPVPEGDHQVELSGPLPATGRIELPLPLAPRLVTTELDSAWRLEGRRANGQVGSQLRLVSLADSDPGGDAGGDAGADSDTSSGANSGLAADALSASAASAPALTPLLRLERSLHLGLTWDLRSRVQRLSPAETSVSLWLPLLPGEAVTSAEAQVVDDRLLLSLAPGQRQLEWSSRLAPSEHLAFQASDDPRLVETWCLGVSPFWHLETAGIASVGGCDLGGTAADAAAPARQWRPWPGETLELNLTRPQAVPGPTLTLDQTRYALEPGRRASEARLTLKVRSSQGGQHPIVLPAGAERLEVRIDGQARGLVLKDQKVDLPLVPGVQQVELRWHQPAGLGLGYRPEPVDLGVGSVNAITEVSLGADRWVLWTQGAGVGPAVLFWSVLLVLALLAWGLARWRLTPLGWHDWLLLGIGLSQADIWVSLLVAGWLLALGWRRRLESQRLEIMSAWRFDLAQIVLVGWTLLALLGLLAAIQQGLLGPPRMQIAGNGSSAGLLRWYLDRSGPELGEVLVVSVPMLAYRLLMLAWALWLALRLLAWLRWGWQAFSQPLLWRALPPMMSRGKTRAPTKPDHHGGNQAGADESLSLDI
ncbi:hypothetical protein [Thiorhodovibrio frisius]|uniref:Uncharacterized protein n=1 Tax=Thiorhodovibrio frisius TaxID=631362 RepID=H8Z4H1_9GAMM|nr:hypothetical protein [Thiorhodovibrio frisius]EIC20228.1 hypothetical protein Thi970DRAFT_03852 [Thiorhodovibrio frisius]WPL20965.1 hypothetical protein Thiofri_01072 [Thiorhodovibrio frisius]